MILPRPITAICRTAGSSCSSWSCLPTREPLGRLEFTAAAKETVLRVGGNFTGQRIYTGAAGMVNCSLPAVTPRWSGVPGF